MGRSILGLMVAAAALVLLLGSEAMAQRGGRGRSGGQKPHGSHHGGHHQHHHHHHKPIYVGGGGWGGSDSGSEAASGDSAGAVEVAEAETIDATPVDADNFLNEKYLVLRNRTSQKVRFFVLFYTEDEGRWEWVPGTPGKTKKALSIELEPGKSRKLQMDNEPITAQKIRIWAKSGDRIWNQYQQSDLYLVDVDASGERRYQADDVATYTFDLTEAAFNKQ